MTLLRSHGKDDEMQNELLVDDEEGSSESSLEDFDDQVPLPLDGGMQDEFLVDDEGSSGSSLEDFDDQVLPLHDGGMQDELSSSISVSYEEMTLEELILECKVKNINADKRNLLVAKLLTAKKEEEMQGLLQEGE